MLQVAKVAGQVLEIQKEFIRNLELFETPVIKFFIVSLCFNNSDQTDECFFQQSLTFFFDDFIYLQKESDLAGNVDLLASFCY